MTDNPDRQYVEVYRARNAAQAHLIRNSLENAGIDVRVENELLQGLAGEMPMGWASMPRILVEESRAEEARTLIKPYETPSATEEEDEEDGTTHCLACGAAMPEEEESCRACGWSYENQEAN